MASKISIDTTRSFGMTSRYSPWKATSNPPFAIITYRHLPPTRRSTSAIVTSPRSPAHQRLISSGVVHALYTRFLGASKSRVIRICVSVGRVTTAKPLFVIFILQFLELLQHDFQPIEALRPRPLVVLHPVMDGFERMAVDPVHPPPSLVTHIHKPALPQHPEVFGHLRLRQVEQGDEFVHGAFPAREDVQDLPSSGFGHRIERICCRRSS